MVEFFVLMNTFNYKQTLYKSFLCYIARNAAIILDTFHARFADCERKYTRSSKGVSALC